MILLLVAAAADTPYIALGTEPFWHTTITRGHLRLDRPGMAPHAVRVSTIYRGAGGIRYIGPHAVVDIVRRPCSDGMSDRLYPDTVTLRWRGEVLRGCGNVAPMPPRR